MFGTRVRSLEKSQLRIRVATGIALLCILSLTCHPFTLSTNTPIGPFPYLGWGESNEYDFLNNALLFVPFGFLLTGCLPAATSLASTSFWVLLLSFLSSYGIELIQIFLPSRFPSGVDVIANTLGGALGLLLFKVRQRGTLAWISFGYCMFVMALSLPLQRTMLLSNWNTTYPLLIGNELTGERPWQGRVYLVAVASRVPRKTEWTVLSVPAVAKKSAPEPFWLAYYRFGGGCPEGLSGKLADFTTIGKLSWRNEAVDLDGNGWLQTTGPASLISNEVAKTSHFTLLVRAASGKLLQTGPARIVSISKDTDHRNLTLGQQRDALVIRMRTPLTGDNGTFPELSVPGVFADTSVKDLAVTYDGARLTVQVNGIRSERELVFSQGRAASGYVCRGEEGCVIAASLAYYSVLFAPLGVLVAHFLRRQMHPSLNVLAATMLLVPHLFLELFLALIADRSLIGANVSWGILCSGIAFICCYRWREGKPFAGGVVC